MIEREHEHTLNVWLAELLSQRGLDAKQEHAAGRRRIDVLISVGSARIALEAEQGQSTAKRSEAIRDADARLTQNLADCAIAVCYPDGITRKEQMRNCRVLWAIRSPDRLRQGAAPLWNEADAAELPRIIRLAPMQLGNPDHTAAALSDSLDVAVSYLNKTQRRFLAQHMDLPQRETRKAGKTDATRWDRAAKRALLVVATAVMFHSRLDYHLEGMRPEYDNRILDNAPFTDEWPPQMAQRCADSDNPGADFSDAWNLILALDYKPIFETGRAALQACPPDPAFTNAVRETAKAALAVAGNIAGLRHDLMGRIFHRVLDSAPYDGSFYTSTPAATLLATLAIDENMRDWNDSDAVANLRIVDPACGTGTLLMAAAERIRDLSPQTRDDDAFAQALIEQVLCGYDVNLTATHMAATTLGLLSPTTSFRKMKIGRAFLGVDEEGDAYLGSLEFLDLKPKMMSWPNAAQPVAQVENGDDMAQSEPADLVIMNPPFTRNSLRHDQFSAADERKIKAREKMLFSNKPVHLSSNGNAFIILADFMRKSEDSKIAVILPLVTATNASALDIRKYIGGRYWVEYIVTSHDPQRIYFSDSTSIGEMLLVCRVWDWRERGKPPTRVVNLAINPSTPAEAYAAAESIQNDSVAARGLGTMQRVSAIDIEAGDWGAVQFLSPTLVRAFVSLGRGELAAALPLESVAAIGPDGRGLRGNFVRSDFPDEIGMTALWDHKSDVTQSMLAEPDTFVTAKQGKEAQAERLWEQRGNLMLPMRARLNTVRMLSVRLNQRALGSAWVPCKPQVAGIDVDTLEKALCVYLNSSVGVLAMLGDRSNKTPSYPQFSMADLHKIPVPDFAALGEPAALRLAAEYDAQCEQTLLPLPRMDADPARAALDAAVCDALRIDAERVATIRRHLAAEPSVTGRRYAGLGQ